MDDESGMTKIFIVGNSRSGTTMLGRVFDRHSQVHTFDELHFFEHQVDAKTIRDGSTWSVDRRIALLERLLTTEREYRHLFAKVKKGQYKAQAEIILSLAKGEDPISVYEAFLISESIEHGKSIPCEQTPRYLFYVQEILDAFPDAIVVNMVRDPRDVLLSQKNKWRRRLIDSKRTPLNETIRAWVNYHPYIIARLWVSAVRTARRFEGEQRFISVRFEDLLLQPEASVRALCSFAGIAFEPNMLQVSQIGSSTEVDKSEEMGIDGSRSYVWRNGGLTDVELAICQSVAGKEMLKMGYVAESIDIASWRRFVSMLNFAFKVVLALILNVRRTKNILETLHRRLGR